MHCTSLSRNEWKGRAPPAKPPPLSKLKAAISRMEGGEAGGAGQGYKRPTQQQHAYGSAARRAMGASHAGSKHVTCAFHAGAGAHTGRWPWVTVGFLMRVWDMLQGRTL